MQDLFGNGKPTAMVATENCIRKQTAMEVSGIHQKWIDLFVAWAKPRKDIRAAIIIGSQAQKDHSHADDWSDLDIAIITSKPGLYTKGNSWMREIAPMWAGLVDTSEVWSGVAAASGFSVYEGGLIVDSVILPTFRAQLAIMCIQLLNLFHGAWRKIDNPVIEFCNELTEFFRRGTIVLFDKDGLTQKLDKIAGSIPQYFRPPPSAEIFQNNVGNFWVDPPRTVANLRRGKLVWAMRTFIPMTRQLYQLAEWHARAKHCWDDGQHYPPKSIEIWAAPSILDTLPQIYPRYDCDDMWKALFELMNLYRRLAVETADLLGYEIDLSTAENIYAWAEKCYQER
jgi:aminoglycoside 6-adenylyltransferase